MREVAEFRCRPETLSATVVRNILCKVRSVPDIGTFHDIVCLRHGRYRVSALCKYDFCQSLVVQLFHRDSCQIWLIRPGDYPLLPADAFML